MQAASLGIPFQPVPGLHGTDLPATSGLAKVRDPYSEEDVYVVPSIRPDWAIVHVHEADDQGNARIHGSPGYDLVMTEAAAHVILTTERLLPSKEFAAHPEWTKVPGILVTAVVLAPGGAFPCACPPDYDVDARGIEAYLRAAGSANDLEDYLSRVDP